MASFQTFRLLPMRIIRDETDEWDCLMDVKERRKRQNRVNQRRSRQRQRISEARQLGASIVPVEAIAEIASSTYPRSSTRSKMASGASVPLSKTPIPTTDLYFPLTRDCQLLHVITFNISRAILTNYLIIGSVPLATSYFCSIRRVFSLEYGPDPPPLPDTPRSVSVVLPPSLVPTKMQQQIPHPGWIDLFPCPRFRDNLILALEENCIDEDGFLLDLVGEALDSLCTPELEKKEPELHLPLGTCKTGHQSDADGTAIEAADPAVATMPRLRESGILSWSDPWEVGGWEISEPFAKKWGFLLDGCQDVIAATNSWREIRDEDPLEGVRV